MLEKTNQSATNKEINALGEHVYFRRVAMRWFWQRCVGKRNNFPLFFFGNDARSSLFTDKSAETERVKQQMQKPIELLLFVRMCNAHLNIWKIALFSKGELVIFAFITFRYCCKYSIVCTIFSARMFVLCIDALDTRHRSFRFIGSYWDLVRSARAQRACDWMIDFCCSLSRCVRASAFPHRDARVRFPSQRNITNVIGFK